MKCKQIFILVFSLLTIFLVQGAELNKGWWKGSLNLQNSHQLQFVFNVDSTQKVTIYNDEEIVEMKSFEFKNDSIKVHFSSFANYLIFKVDSLNTNKIAGYFVNPDRKKYSRIEFNAYHNSLLDNDLEIKVNFKHQKYQNVAGKWQVTFDPNTDDKYPAIGKFEQKNNLITGTFLTETGDYRFLKGLIFENEVRLTSFDGAHVFLFTATLENDTLKGEFLSGNHWKTDWIGVRNEEFQLKDPDSLTYMVKDTFDFNFKTVNGADYAYPNESLKGKVVIVQILGTWCPNCLDETNFYKELYDEYNANGLEIIGVAYEAPDNLDDQVDRINRYRENKDVPYQILVGGLASKDGSSKDFNMLNRISSFPTSIFINKDEEVVKIHTGFNGPGTGEIYEEYKIETIQLINKLLRE
jgi:thiol-disulfide isomerase/thioredoxin